MTFKNIPSIFDKFKRINGFLKNQKLFEFNWEINHIKFSKNYKNMQMIF